jgi:hypothetical protein
MPEPAAPFAVDPGTAAQALVLAESAAREVLERSVLLEHGAPPRESVACATFLPAGGAWAYPGS